MRTSLFESSFDLKLWGDAIAHADWIRSYLPANRIELKVAFKLWLNQKLDVKRILKSGKPGYTFQHRSDSSASQKTLPRVVFGYFVSVSTKIHPTFINWI